MWKRRKRPELIQFGELTVDHFRRHPVWVGVHTTDYDEPWYDDTNEETFRPWLGDLPVDPATGMFLARAKLALADGTVLLGFATPAPADRLALGETGIGDELGIMQPQMFLPTGSIEGFWRGRRDEEPEVLARIYQALGRDADKVFPLQFAVDEKFVQGRAAGLVRGFYYLRGWREPPVVRV